MFEESEAKKSQGTYNQKYGSATKGLVCGDKLCSEVPEKKTESKSFSFGGTLSAPVAVSTDKQIYDLGTTVNYNGKIPDVTTRMQIQIDLYDNENRIALTNSQRTNPDGTFSGTFTLQNGGRWNDNLKIIVTSSNYDTGSTTFCVNDPKRGVTCASEPSITESTQTESSATIMSSLSFDKAEYSFNDSSILLHGTFPLCSTKSCDLIIDVIKMPDTLISSLQSTIRSGDTTFSTMIDIPISWTSGQYKIKITVTQNTGGGILNTETVENSFSFIATDTDNDKIIEPLDSCPLEPETYNQFQDTDGCPDSNPEFLDTDGDGIIDSEETFLRMNLQDTDPDGDKISNKDELILGTNPFFADSDSDLLDDSKEIDLGTNPVNSDSDFDGLSDFAEVFVFKTDPLLSDTDNDGFSDKDELMANTDPLTKTDNISLVDSDGDNI